LQYHDLEEHPGLLILAPFCRRRIDGVAGVRRHDRVESMAPRADPWMWNAWTAWL
jgi:hypothetical protein